MIHITKALAALCSLQTAPQRLQRSPPLAALHPSPLWILKTETAAQSPWHHEQPGL